MTETTHHASGTAALEEATRYARLLERGTWVGLAALVIGFVAYLSGLLPAHVPLEQLPAAWVLPVRGYLQQTGTPTGWGWLALVQRGDMSTLIGIALLASCSIPPLLALIPLFLRQHDRVYAVICALIAGVLLLAASGVLDVGH